jgi:hypothetical protein
VIQRLSAELLKILANPEVRKRIEDTGSITRPGSARGAGQADDGRVRQLQAMAAESGIKME